jgi:hypothetical protein
MVNLSTRRIGLAVRLGMVFGVQVPNLKREQDPFGPVKPCRRRLRTS